MKALSKRLEALECGKASPLALWTDNQIVDRMNAISVELRPFGLAFPLLDGGPEDAESLRLGQKMLSDAQAAVRVRDDVNLRYNFTEGALS